MIVALARGAPASKRQPIPGWLMSYERYDFENTEKFLPGPRPAIGKFLQEPAILA
jgi:hypothetical protein